MADLLRFGGIGIGVVRLVVPEEERSRCPLNNLVHYLPTPHDLLLSLLQQVPNLGVGDRIWVIQRYALQLFHDLLDLALR
jgi:hypothetical protein